MKNWKPDFWTRLSGESCELCSEGRPQETEHRLRFFSTELCDAYLHYRGVQRGFVGVIWRGGHAIEPTDLGEEEAVTFWLDVLRIGKAMQEHYKPLKMNYQLLGNGQPHLHWLIAPCFADDVAPNGPLPASNCISFPVAEVRQDALALRALLET